MSGGLKAESVSKQGTLFAIMVILFSLVPLSLYADTVEASTTGEMGIISSTPSDDSVIASFESLLFGVTVENYDSKLSPQRNIEWNVCLGDKAANSCLANSIANGQISVTPILSGQQSYFESDNYYNPNGLNQTITVVYQFNQLDANPSNDILVYNLNPSMEFTDLRIASEQNLFEPFSNINYEGERPILNSNKSYNVSIKGYANVCQTCSLNVTFGWELWDYDNNQKIDSSYANLTSFPQYSYYGFFTSPTIEIYLQNQGNYTIRFGYFNFTGNPYDDLISENNLASIEIIIDDTLDLALLSMNPVNTGVTNEYLYGNEMVEVMVENRGNITVQNVSVILEVIDFDGSNIYSSNCPLNIMEPNDIFLCKLDLLVQGESLTIRASVISSTSNFTDSRPDNNIIDEFTSINVSSLSAYIVFENQKDWYTNQEQINISGFSNLFAPGPVSHSWWYSGLINIGNQNTITLNASDYGLGEHIFRYTVTDIFGNTENIYFTINVYYEVSWDNYPYSSATGVTPAEATITHTTELPMEGETYGIGNGRSPLMLLTYDLNSEFDDSLFTGTNWIDIAINYTEILPSTIPSESIDIRKLDSRYSTSWDFFDINNYTINTQEQKIIVRLYEGSTILLIGNLSTPSIEAFKFNASPISDGRFSLTWESKGETDNMYLQGWSIYKKIVSKNGGTIFPPTSNGFNQLIWDDLTSDTYMTTVSINSTNWIDQLYLDSNFCASYAIAPTDRVGVTHFQIANVTTNIHGEAAFVCGDSTPPSSTVLNLQHEWRFTNSTDCYLLENDWSMCYEVELTWEWPALAGEENITWNLYRIESQPNGIDLKLATPIVSEMANIVGQQATYTESGIDDENLKPKRTYFYILTPIDNVGNERTVTIYPSPNVERVHIEDDWWAYNQHVIPEPEPEPEPPLNNEWLGNFSDSLDHQEFQTAGIVTLITLCFGVIMLAFISKRLKRLKRVISARNRRLAANSMASEFDEFFE